MRKILKKLRDKDPAFIDEYKTLKKKAKSEKKNNSRDTSNRDTLSQLEYYFKRTAYNLDRRTKAGRKQTKEKTPAELIKELNVSENVKKLLRRRKRTDVDTLQKLNERELQHYLFMKKHQDKQKKRKEDKLKNV